MFPQKPQCSLSPVPAHSPTGGLPDLTSSRAVSLQRLTCPWVRTPSAPKLPYQPANAWNFLFRSIFLDMSRLNSRLNKFVQSFLHPRGGRRQFRDAGFEREENGSQRLNPSRLHSFKTSPARLSSFTHCSSQMIDSHEALPDSRGHPSVSYNLLAWGLLLFLHMYLSVRV